MSEENIEKNLINYYEKFNNNVGDQNMSITNFKVILLNLVDIFKMVSIDEVKKKPKVKINKNNDIYDPNVFGISEIMEECKELLLEDVHKIKINEFYPSVMKQLIENDILDIHEDYAKVFLIVYEFYMKKRRIRLNEDGLTLSYAINFYKSWIYCSFSFFNGDRYSHLHGGSTSIITYTRIILNEILDHFYWFFVDTDTILCYDKQSRNDNRFEKFIKTIFNKFDLKYHHEKLDNVIVLDRKNYLELSKRGNINIHGHLIRRGDKEHFLHQLEIVRRDRQIDRVFENE